MSNATSWVKIRKRRYTWQDKTGKTSEGTAWMVDAWQLNGDRLQRSFRDKKKALALVEQLKAERRVEQKNRSVSLANLEDDQRIDVIGALKILAGKGTLRVAAQFFVDHNVGPAGESLTVTQAVDRYIGQSIEDDLRPRSVSDLRVRLGRLVTAFGDKLVTGVTRQEVQGWLDGLRHGPGNKRKYAALSLKHYRVVAHGFYSWLIERGYAKLNPFARLTAGRRSGDKLSDQKMPGILRVEQVEKLMLAATQETPELVPALAVSFFAGLRSNEVSLLDWQDINFDLNLITVRPEVAKRRRARHVEMATNLVQWLLPYRRERGLLAPEGTLFRLRLDTARTAAGFKAGDWPHNAARHTYASHALTKQQDAAKVALQLGHTTTHLLFDHYRGLVTPQEAERYFNIRPPAEASIIRFPALSA